MLKATVLKGFVRKLGWAKQNRWRHSFASLQLLVCT